MAIFRIEKNKLNTISEEKIDLEKDVQKRTEENLETVFGLKFISGSLNQEFSIRANEQDFYIDTLAFDEANRSIVLIEYKKDKSFSIIDQGFAYLAAMLNNKADFVLEINERLGKKFSKKDIDWEQSRIIFISNEFTNYQKNAINFKDLPMFLYEVKVYDNDIIDYNPIKPFRTSESINKFIKDKDAQKVTKEVKVYTIDNLLKSNWTDTKSLLDEFEKQLLSSDIETKIKYTKYYIAYMSKHGRNYVEAVPQQQGLKIYFRFPYKSVKSDLKIGDCSKIGHWTNGISYILLTKSDEIAEATRLSKESFNYLHRDIYK
jgi:predicted transport protein